MLLMLFVLLGEDGLLLWEPNVLSGEETIATVGVTLLGRIILTGNSAMLLLLLPGLTMLELAGFI